MYIEYAKLEIKSALEYKVSFILNFISQIFVMFSLYFMIIALFTKFSNINGFTLYEVLLCFGIVQFGFSFNETFFRGLDHFEELIINGDLDRYIVRPQNILFQVMSSHVDLVKLSRVIQSFIIIIISLINLNINWNISKIFVLLLMIFSSIIIFFGLFVLMASYCFLTIQGLEVKNLVTDGGKQVAQYPIGIFKKGFALIFTIIIPFAFVNYYPLLFLLGRTNNMLYMLSPLVVIIYLIPCLLSFKLGLKRYSSTGS